MTSHRVGDGYGNMITGGARAEASRARAIGAGWLQRFGRVGWAAKGAVYVLLGILTVPIALGGGGGGEEASTKGAIAEIADHTFGGVILMVLSVGLVLHALWLLVTATLPGDDGASTWVNRAASFGSAVLYGALAGTALRVALGGGGADSAGSGDESAPESISASLLGTTAGRLALGIGALIGIGVGGYQAYKAVQRSFLDDLDLSGASTTERQLIERSGVAGWIGRAVTTGLVSLFVLRAAITSDPDEAKSLDEALRETADTGWGAVLVLLVGVCLIAYGAFAAVSSRRRLLLGP